MPIKICIGIKTIMVVLYILTNPNKESDGSVIIIIINLLFLVGLFGAGTWLYFQCSEYTFKEAVK